MTNPALRVAAEALGLLYSRNPHRREDAKGQAFTTPARMGHLPSRTFRGG